jgi:hypothetical protein
MFKCNVFFSELEIDLNTCRIDDSMPAGKKGELGMIGPEGMPGLDGRPGYPGEKGSKGKIGPTIEC